MSPKQSRKTTTKSPSNKGDDFKSVARRLECDEDLEAFDAKLKKIAKAAPSLDEKRRKMPKQ
jgi:hypothetical protein